MFPSTSAGLVTHSFGPLAMVPPQPMTKEYIQGFRKTFILSSVAPDSPIHRRFASITENLRQNSDSKTRDLGSFLSMNYFESSQLQLLETLLTHLWVKPGAAQIQLLNQVLDIQAVSQINQTNYFTYLNVFYQAWEETLKVAVIHNRYDSIKSFFAFGIDDKITWSAIEAQAQQYPEGKTALLKKEVDVNFASKRQQYDVLMAEVPTSLASGQLDASVTTPLSSSSSLPSSSSASTPLADTRSGVVGYSSLHAMVDPKLSFSASLKAAIQQDNNDVLVMDIATQMVGQYGDLGSIPVSLLAQVQHKLQPSTYGYLLQYSQGKPMGASTELQPSAPPAPILDDAFAIPSSSSSTASQASAPLSPISVPVFSHSSAVAPSLLHVTPEISPSMVHKGSLLIDTKVSVTRQGAKAVRKPVHVIFIVDVSGSMRPAISDVQQTLISMVNTKLRAGDKVSIIKFDHTASVVLNACTLPDMSLTHTITTEIRTGGSTNIGAGFEALRSLTQTDLETHVILATDGQDDKFSRNRQPNAGGLTRERYAQQMIDHASAYMGKSLPIHTIGMTTDVDQGIIGTLSTKTGAAQQFIRAQQAIAQAVDTLANYICADDRMPAGRMEVTQNGKILQTFDIPSLLSGNPYPQLVRLSTSAVDVQRPISIQYDFPNTAPVIREVSYNPSIVANIDAIAADIVNRYEQLIVARRGEDLKSELLGLLVDIIELKTKYQHASWTELHKAEDKVRCYIAAIEGKDTAQQMDFNTQTIGVHSLLPAFVSQPSTTTPTPAKQPPIAALNHHNVAAHIAQAIEKKWSGVLIALHAFAGQATSPEIKLLAAIDKADIAAIQSCFDEGVDPNKVDARGWSWVMQALSKAADVSVIATLVQRGVPLNVRSNASRVDALAMANSHLSAMQAANFLHKPAQVARLTAIIVYLQQQTPAPTLASPLIQTSLFPAASSSTSSPAPVASVDVPEDMLCPISLEIMADPVIISTGISVDKATLLQHLALKERQGLPATCPLSNTPLEKMPGGTFYLSNVTLKNTIEQWQKQYQQPSTSMGLKR